MNIMLLPRWFSRFLAVALLLLVFSVFMWLVLEPLRALFSSLADQQSSLEEKLAHDQILINQLPTLRKQVEQLRADVNPDSALWQSATSNSAAAEMQAFIMQSASANQVQITTTQTLPQLLDHGLERFGVVVDLRSSLNGLQPLLYALESHVPALFVQNMTLRSLNPGAVITEPPSEPMLEIRAEIFGFRLPSQGALSEQ